MNVFLSDLDNTLIYSYKQDIGTDKILVETNNGIELSYMTGTSYQLLDEIKEKVHVIPITTRSLQQYNRITLNKEWVPDYALVANGGILLNHGVIEEQWLKDSVSMSAPASGELDKSIKILKRDEKVCFEVRRVDRLFVFTKTNDFNHTVELLSKELDTNLVSIFHNGSKVYVFPKKINKGHSLLRLKEKLGAEFIICAGDSEFDIPMLEVADIAMMPNKLGGLVSCKGKKIVFEKGIFSDRLLEYLHSSYECFTSKR